MRTLHHLVRYHRLIVFGNDKAYRAEHLTSAAHILAAQRLLAQVYVRQGYVTADDIDASGVIRPVADPYGATARYFGTWQLSRPGRSSQLVATGRLIEAMPGDRHSVFQTYRELELYPAAKAQVESATPTACAEVSGLAKLPGQSTVALLLLYRAMWRYSLASAHQLWLMAADERLFGRLQQLFGAALTPAGPSVYFKGHQVVPAVLDLASAKTHLQTLGRVGSPWRRLLHRGVRRFMLHGTPSADGGRS